MYLVCTNCKKQYSDGLPYCPHCAEKECSKCYRIYNADLTECPYCYTHKYPGIILFGRAVGFSIISILAFTGGVFMFFYSGDTFLGGLIYYIGVIFYIFLIFFGGISMIISFFWVLIAFISFIFSLLGKPNLALFFLKEKNEKRVDKF